MIKKLMPIPSSAHANFRGVDGARSPSLDQMAAKIGAKMMMKMGLIDCSHGTGIVNPPTVRSVLSSANTDRVDPAWS